MNIFSITCFLLLLFSHLPVPTTPYMFNGFEVLDLQYDYPTFTYEALVWKDSEASSGSSITLACSSGTEYIIGGPAKSTSGADNYFSRVYTGIQHHTMIYYSFDLWIIDTWASGSISIGFDSHVQTSSWIFISNNFPPVTSECGGSGADLSAFRVFGKALHSGSTLTFKLMGVPTSSSTTGSLGLRNLNLLFVAEPDSKTEDICGIVTVTSGTYVYALNTNSCPSTEGSYLPNSMSPMLPCDTNCESCFGGTAKDCYKCADTSRFNGTQCVSCSQTDQNILDADGVCKNCQGFEIVYDKRTDTGHYFQMYLVPEPCDLNEYEVRNNLAFEAKDNDDFPDFDFLVSKLDDNLYQIELIMKGDSVKETDVTVTLYYLTGTMTVPRTFLVTSLIESLNKATLPMQIVLAIIMAISFFGAVALKNTEILWHIVGFMQFVEYLQFINIVCPPQVYSFISYFGFSLWDFLPGISNSAQDGLALTSLDYAPKSMKAKWNAPQQFRNQDIDSFFLANGGFLNFLVSILMLLTLAMIILLRNSPSFSRSNTVKFLKVKLRWRATIRFFLYSCIPLSMSIFLQLRAITFSNGYIAFSAVLTIFSLIYLLAMTVFLVKILYKRPASLLSMQLIKNIYGTIYDGIKFNDKGTGKYYYLVVMVRGILLTVLVALAETIPLVQIVGVLYLSIGVIVYLLKKTTFTNRGSNWVIKINEFVMMVIQLCMLCLHFEVKSKVFYQVFGWMMAILVTIGFSGPFVYYMGIQIFEINKIVKTISAWSKPRRTPPSVQGVGNKNEVIKLRPQERSQIFTASETSLSYNINDNSMIKSSNNMNDNSTIRSSNNMNDSSMIRTNYQ